VLRRQDHCNQTAGPLYTAPQSSQVRRCQIWPVGSGGATKGGL